jgi:hypothetical protein
LLVQQLLPEIVYGQSLGQQGGMSSTIANATVISRTLFRMLNQRANAEWEVC